MLSRDVVIKNLIFGVAVALVGCGGFSNDDLPFLNAVPRREDLASKLPASSSTSALHGPGNSAVILLGEYSPFYDSTHTASESFNNGLDGLLSVIEGVISYPPTTRTTDTRTWGPYPDKDHPGFNLALVIQRDSSNFTYWIQFQQSSNAPWFHFVEGNFVASEGVRKGQGQMFLHLQMGRDNGLITPANDGLAGISELDAAYNTVADPVTVGMMLTGTNGATVAYNYDERASGQGQFGFVFLYNNTSWSATTRWVPGGAGVGQANATDGVNSEAWTDCWNSNFDVVFDQTVINSVISTSVGDVANCQPLN